MKNNRRWKDMLLGAVLATVVSCMVVPVLAYSGTKTEKLSYNNIRVELDGTKLTLRDGSGNIVEPFILDGTTYLPVRAIAEAVGLNVSWDSSTQTVELTTTDNTGSTGDYIGQEKAKSIALNHAGVSASAVSFVKVELGYDDGRMEYEVEFWSGNKEYDYDIDAVTGAIRSYDYDIENYEIPGSSSQSGNYIGQEKAKTIALNHAGVSTSAASFVKVELDYDDGRAEYEVEFWSGNKEYDYSIDALTGEIRSYDYDIENYNIPGTSTSQSGSYIGETRAKEIVRAKAGITGGTFKEFKLDYDDGRAVYEGELRNGRTEYEFEIDAVSGTVLKWEMDN